jgi:hypothetical protein
MKWMEGRMRKKLGMLAVSMSVWAVNVRQDGICEDTYIEIYDVNGEFSEADESE